MEPRRDMISVKGMAWLLSGGETGGRRVRGEREPGEEAAAVIKLSAVVAGLGLEKEAVWGEDIRNPKARGEPYLHVGEDPSGRGHWRCKGPEAGPARRSGRWSPLEPA